MGCGSSAGRGGRGDGVHGARCCQRVFPTERQVSRCWRRETKAIMNRLLPSSWVSPDVDSRGEDRTGYSEGGGRAVKEGEIKTRSVVSVLCRHPRLSQ